MAAAKLDELKADVAELHKLLLLAQRPKVRGIFTIECRKLETEIANLQDALKMETDVIGKISGGIQQKTSLPSNNKCYDVKLTNYAWDQSDKFVKIFVTVNDVHTIPESCVHCDFDNRCVELIVRGLGNRNYLFTVKNLLEDINASNSKWKVKKDMVVIFLAKTQTANWSYLTTVEKKVKEPKSQIPKMDPNEDPSSGLMDLMKKMYEDGDDEMKRTIAKSWTENAARKNTEW